MLTPLDEYPIHQTALPLAQPGGGHPDFYDRYWFNGFRDDLYFAVALGVYPNKGIIDAAFSVVHAGFQRSVFASGRLPLDQRELRIGPITIEILDPFRINRITVDAAEFGLEAELTYHARTAVLEEARQTHYQGTRLWMDSTRGTQFGRWSGALTITGEPVEIETGSSTMLGVKDRSWGVRAVSGVAGAAPTLEPPQVFFLWAPLHFDDCALHGLAFEDAEGRPWAETAALVPVIDGDAPTWGPGCGIDHLRSMRHKIDWAPGLRRSRHATLEFTRASGELEIVDLEPTLTFRMRGAGYSHPVWGHGRWHDELAVGGETHRVDELDSLDPSCLHVQQVVRARWGARTGIGVLEQAVLGPHAPSGFTGYTDGGTEA
jgi:hypothetical protein